MPRKKRKLDLREIRIVVHTRGLRKDGNLRKHTTLHIARQTVKGAIIKACDDQTEVDLWSVYYFPFVRFIYDCAPMCALCVAAMQHEGIDAPYSNTGVNSDNE